MRIAWSLALIAAALLYAVPAAGEAKATVTGTVRLASAAPTRTPLPVYKNKEVCGENVPDERLVVGPGGGVRYAVVTVDDVRGGRKPERDVALLLDNRGCRFEPHVQVAEVGQWLEIRNSDPLLHNADARLGAETLFNVGLPPGRQVRKPLARAGLVKVTCDVRHTWMTAYVAVAEHPYHTVTDAYGAFEIRDLPAGRYTVRVWHEELGTLERQVVLGPGATAPLDVTYPAPDAEGKRP